LIGQFSDGKSSSLRSGRIATVEESQSIHRLPTILSQEEVALLIDASCTPLSSQLLMTLYATGVRSVELTGLKISDVDSR